MGTAFSDIITEWHTWDKSQETLTKTMGGKDVALWLAASTCRQRFLHEGIYDIVNVLCQCLMGEEQAPPLSQLIFASNMVVKGSSYGLGGLHTKLP